MQVVNSFLITHPPENFFFAGIIVKHFNIGRSPTAAANNSDLVCFYIHQNKNVLPGLIDRTNLGKNMFRVHGSWLIVHGILTMNYQP